MRVTGFTRPKFGTALLAFSTHDSGNVQRCWWGLLVLNYMFPNMSLTIVCIIGRLLDIKNVQCKLSFETPLRSIRYDIGFITNTKYFMYVFLNLQFLWNAAFGYEAIQSVSRINTQQEWCCLLICTKYHPIPIKIPIKILVLVLPILINMQVIR